MTDMERSVAIAKLKEHEAELKQLGVEHLYLFGSTVRGDARPDSDYDVAVFLRELPDRWSELHRLADLRVKLIDDTGAFFDVLPYPAAAYADRSPLMREIRLDGFDL